MNTVQIIRNLANKKNISFAELERLTGLSNGTIARWNNASPNSKGLEAIADFFNVSVDYLLGRENNSQMDIMYKMNTDGFNASDTNEMRLRLAEFEKLLRLDILERKKNNKNDN